MDLSGSRRELPASSPNLAGMTDHRPERRDRLSDFSGAATEARSLSMVDDQLKKERIWWSEQTLFEVQKVELTVKQELQKTATTLREQFRRQFEMERNDSQLRASSMERALGRLREDLDAVRDQQQQQSVATPVEAAAVQRLAESLAEVEGALRLEIKAVRAGLEDFHRQHSEELSVAMARQAHLEQTCRHGEAATAQMVADSLAQSEAALRRDLQGLRAALEDRLDQTTRPGEAATSQMLSEAVARSEATLRREISALGAALEDAQRQRSQDMSDAAAAHQALDAALQRHQDQLRRELGRPAEADDVQRLADALSQCDASWRSQVEEMRRDLEGALRQQKEELAAALGGQQAELQEARYNFAMQARTAADEAVGQHLQLVAPPPADTGDTVRDLVGLLEAEVKARKADVDELRNLIGTTEALVIERTSASGPHEEIMASVIEMDSRLQGLVSALEMERESRRADWERMQAGLADAMDAVKCEQRLREHEVSRLHAVVSALDARRTDWEQMQAGLADAVRVEQQLREHEAASSPAASASAFSTGVARQQQLQAHLQTQSLISEDLKDSLEKLVGRVNRMLRPEGSAAGSGTSTPASYGIRTPMSVVSATASVREGSFPPRVGWAPGGGPAGLGGSVVAGSQGRRVERQASGHLLPQAFDALGTPNEGPSASFSTSSAQAAKAMAAEQTARIQQAVKELQEENHALRGDIALSAPPGSVSPPSATRPLLGRGQPDGLSKTSPRGGLQAPLPQGAAAGPPPQAGAALPRTSYPGQQAPPVAGRGAALQQQLLQQQQQQQMQRAALPGGAPPGAVGVYPGQARGQPQIMRPGVRMFAAPGVPGPSR